MNYFVKKLKGLYIEREGVNVDVVKLKACNVKKNAAKRTRQHAMVFLLDWIFIF